MSPHKQIKSLGRVATERRIIMILQKDGQPTSQYAHVDQVQVRHLHQYLHILHFPVLM